MQFRHPGPAEIEAVNLLVHGVIDEIYGDVVSSSLTPVATTDWSPAWVAVTQGSIVGVALTTDMWVEDLWVVPAARGQGIGKALLARCEDEIRDRNFTAARLRVASSNHRAMRFYEARGWAAQRTYRHEHLPIVMTEFLKHLKALQ